MTDENLPDDDLLLRTARDSDGQAFAHLIRRYQARIIRFAARVFNGDLDAGADIAQETFVRLWESRHTYVARGKLLPYLLRIAYNLCMSRLRSPESKLVGMSVAETTCARGAPMELSLAVQDALHDLPEPQRVVFLLHEYEGLSYKEIADILSISMGTVASRKNSAVQALRESLAPWFGRENK
ncbi:MAG: RNA polymerase sigma factor [Akkermansiaceae bacterium]|nr:RNA polymerase sigma factor [Armatimonadota bacterium]